MWNGQEYIKFDMFNIMYVIDWVGMGDVFVAGLIYGLLYYEFDEQVFSFVLVVCVFKYIVFGDVNMVLFENVFSLMNGNIFGVLKCQWGLIKCLECEGFQIVICL